MSLWFGISLTCVSDMFTDKCDSILALTLVHGSSHHNGATFGSSSFSCYLLKLEELGLYWAFFCHAVHVPILAELDGSSLQKIKTVTSGHFSDIKHCKCAVCLFLGASLSSVPNIYNHSFCTYISKIYIYFKDIPYARHFSLLQFIKVLWEKCEISGAPLMASAMVQHLLGELMFFQFV